MMRILSLLLCVFCWCGAVSQDTPSRTIILGTLSFSGVGVAAEWNAHKRFTVETSVVYGHSYYVEGNAFFRAALAYPVYRRTAVRFAVTSRIYLNAATRPVQAGRVEPYLGVMLAYYTAPFGEN